MRVHVSFVLGAALGFMGMSASAHGATVEKQTFVGKQAATTFSGSATIACAGGGSGQVSAFGSISGSENISKQTGSPKSVSNGVFVEIDSYSNDCTGASLGFSDGGFANGFTPPNAQLHSAGIEGTALMQDFDTGNQIPVVIDIVFQGSGPLSASKSSQKTKTVDGPGGPVTITISKSANANRAADVSGTISIDGVPLDLTFSSSTMSDNASTTITIERK